jgi:hypothetical protein
MRNMFKPNFTKSAALLLLGALFLAAAAPTRPMPFNKNNVYAYFRHVDELKREIPANMAGPEREAELCRIHAAALSRSGYSLDATVAEAVARINALNKKMDNPRFAFLAGTFQIHPDVFLKLKLISKKNRDAVIALFSDQP